jgi:hypothetical protein
MIPNTFEYSIAQFREAAKNFAHSSAIAIDHAIAPLAQHRDKRSIRAYLQSLLDDAEDDAGMFSLIHAAEDFDDDTYVNELLMAIPDLQNNSPRWASILLMRVMNNDSAKEVLVSRLRAASPEIKEAVTWLCEKINERSPKFLSKTLVVLLAAKQ